MTSIREFIHALHNKHILHGCPERKINRSVNNMTDFDSTHSEGVYDEKCKRNRNVTTSVSLSQNVQFELSLLHRSTRKYSLGSCLNINIK